MRRKTVITNYKIQGGISQNKYFLYGLLAGTDVATTA